MINSPHAETLRIPLYKLYYLDIIEENPLTPGELEQLYIDYTSDEVRAIVESLEWAERNPMYPFASLLPASRYSNEEAYKYLVNLLHQIKRHAT